MLCINASLNKISANSLDSLYINTSNSIACMLFILTACDVIGITSLLVVYIASEKINNCKKLQNLSNNNKHISINKIYDAD